MNHVTRRDWLKAASASSLLCASGDLLAREEREPLPVAAVVTEYRTNSHADVIVGKILEGYRQDGGPGPNLRVASMYVDQVGKADLSRGLGEKHGIRLCETIEEAITLGSGEVKVGGVLSVGEHGNYPSTPDTKQKMYPRRRFFDGIADAFEKAEGRAPVFSDKHLSYRWSDAKHMYDRAKRMKIPFMAGSSLPVAWRKPALALPIGCEIEEALAIGYGGLESYGFHALETLQCMVERRRGGEQGVVSVQAAQGEQIESSRRRGKWSEALFEAALDVIPAKSKKKDWRKRLSKKAAFYLLEYGDGLRATVAMAQGVAGQFAFAAKLRGVEKPVATWFWLEDNKPYGHFEYLLRAVERMFQTGKPSYPIERTLLTTGVLDEAMHSVADGGKLRQTAHLKIAYQPVDWPYATVDPKPIGKRG